MFASLLFSNWLVKNMNPITKANRCIKRIQSALSTRIYLKCSGVQRILSSIIIRLPILWKLHSEHFFCREITVMRGRRVLISLIFCQYFRRSYLWSDVLCQCSCPPAPLLSWLSQWHMLVETSLENSRLVTNEMSKQIWRRNSASSNLSLTNRYR